MLKNNFFIYMAFLLITLLVSIFFIQILRADFKDDLPIKCRNITTMDSPSKKLLFKKIIRLLRLHFLQDGLDAS